MTQAAGDAVPETTGTLPPRRRSGPSWMRIFVIGLVLWVASVLATFG
jgi:hypothetical protein